MASEKKQKLPVFTSLTDEENNKKGSSAMTKKGAYAAISYMVSAGTLLALFSNSLHHFLLSFIFSSGFSFLLGFCVCVSL